MKRADTFDILQKSVEKLSLPSGEDEYILQHEMPLPSIEKLKEVVDLLRSVIFYGYYGEPCVHPETIRYHIGVKMERLYHLLSEQILYGSCFNIQGHCSASSECAEDLALLFINRIPEIKRVLHTDVRAILEGDPAAKSYGEVIFCYPAVRALLNHRVAHELLLLGVPILPRIISEMAHSETGIDIHPGAKIGESFSIDHGTGVVIGETCIIGDRVRLYQGVTLGAKRFVLDEKGSPMYVPRHPILEDNVVVYANTSILGRVTIGKDSVIGGNVWLTVSVPPGSHVLQQKALSNTFSDGLGI